MHNGKYPWALDLEKNWELVRDEFHEYLVKRKQEEDENWGGARNTDAGSILIDIRLGALDDIRHSYRTLHRLNLWS